MHHTNPVEGLWTFTSIDHPDSWPGAHFFDTRSEVIEYARGTCAHTFRIGKVRPLTEAIVAKLCVTMLSADDIDEKLYGNDWASEEGMVNEPSDKAVAELTDYLEGWLKRNRIVKAWFQVDAIETVPWSGRK